MGSAAKENLIQWLFEGPAVILPHDMFSRRRNVAAENDTSHGNHVPHQPGITRIGRQNKQVDTPAATPGTPKQNRGRGELSASKVWDRDIHDGSL